MSLRILTTTVFILTIIVLAACAPSRQHTERGADKATPVSPPTLESFPKVTFSHEAGPLGDTVRKFGQEVGGGIVVLSGLEERSVPAISANSVPYASFVSDLADAVECVSAPLTHAYFIYPEPYHSLLQVSLEGRLHERFASMNASVAFGAKTPLYNVLAVLSESLGTAIVADNYIAQATCGEISMDKAPLQAILEAVLMSARIPSQEIAVDCTEEYLFIASLRNSAPPTALISDEKTLTPEQQTALDRTVDVILPDIGADPVQTAFVAKPVRLQDALTPLTRQLNVQVAAKKVLADVPINPCTLHKVRVRTAIDLLIRQWPVASFGYEVTGSQLLIRAR